MMPIANRIFLRSNMSASLPPHTAPTMVPISVITEKPVRCRRGGQPLQRVGGTGITAVSNPKISPPSEPTIALLQQVDSCAKR